MYRDQVPDPSMIVDGKYDGHTILDRPPGSKVMRAGPYYGVVEPIHLSGTAAKAVIRIGRIGEQTEIIMPLFNAETVEVIDSKLEAVVRRVGPSAPAWLPVLLSGGHWVDLGCSLPHMAAEVLLLESFR